jgi:hypothetical protein
LLKREGLVINHKRTERIYREEGLALRKKRRRKGAAGVRVVMPSPQRTNERWSMDFVTDSIVTGRRFRALAIVDDYSRECPAIEVDTSLGGRRVVGVLERLVDVITMDNGPEFVGRALDEWWELLWSKVEGNKILEVGVGTGKSFPFYPPGAEVTAIDFSIRMLVRARAIRTVSKSMEKMFGPFGDIM